MIILLYARDIGEPTGPMVAEELGATAIPSSYRGRLNADVVVCWGTHRRMPGVGLCVNNVFCSKKEALITFEREGIPAIRLTMERGVALCDQIWRRPVHSQGYGLKFFRAGERIRAPENWYGTIFVPSTEEYRVHVGRGEVILAQRKMEKPGADPIVRSNKRGWAFVSYMPRDLLSPLYQNAINAVKSLGLDFGAVDVLKANTGEYVVCEVNTMPGLRDANVLLYARWLQSICG